MDVKWYRGVPWIPQALTSAVADGIADQLNEVAREFRDSIQYDPGRVPPADVVWVERGDYTVGVNHDLVVVGHERPGKGSSAASGPDGGPEADPSDVDRPKGRGPKDYAELIEWLEDAGYAVPRAGGHYAVIDGEGHRLVTLNHSPSDNKRALLNDTAVCRRVLGIALRREK